MKIAAWNIRHGGGRRLQRVVAALRSHDPDVIVLSEYRGTTGPCLCSALQNHGWSCLTSGPSGRTNGVLVASKQPMVTRPPHPLAPSPQERWLEIELPRAGLTLAALHIPLKQAKQAFWESVAAMARARAHETCVFIGDFNTGKHRVDEVGTTLKHPEYMDRMEELGWVDAWRFLHPYGREYTWYSGIGNGFRLDLAFLSPGAAARLSSAWYSHVEREAGVSDHSLLLVELAASASPE